MIQAATPVRRRRGITITSTAAGTSFNPLSLSPAFWVKADAGTSTTTDGVAISQWSDQSGNARHLAQATGSKQPLYKAAIQNGLPVVRFDGTDDFLQVIFTISQPEHVFVVCQYRTAWAANAAILDGGSGPMEMYRASSTQVNMFVTADADIVTTTPQAWHVYGPLFNGAGSENRVDGGVAATGNCGTTAGNGITVGAANGGTQAGAIDVGEVLMYNTALSATDRQAVEAYLKSRWGTP